MRARPLKRELTGHDVSTVVERGWSSKRNSELLRLMLAEGFEALLTVDQNLPFQQNVVASGVAVVVVVARNNPLKEVRPPGPAVLAPLRRPDPVGLTPLGPPTPPSTDRRAKLRI